MDSVPLLTVASMESEKNGKRWVGATSSLGWMPSGAESVQETLIYRRQIHKLGLSGDDGLDTPEAKNSILCFFSGIRTRMVWFTYSLVDTV